MEEFRSAFEKNVVPDGDCLLWKGSFYGNGIPYVQVGKQRIAARRVSWILAGGAAFSRNFRVTCRNPSCVHADHLMPQEVSSRSSVEPYGERLSRGQRMIDGDLGINHSVDVVQKSVRYRDSFV